MNSLNFRIILEDVRESIFTYDLGVSRLTTWDDSLSPLTKVKYAISRIPNIIYRNIIGLERQDVEEIFIQLDII